MPIFRVMDRVMALACIFIFSAGNSFGGEYINPKAPSARQKENEWVVIEKYRDAEMTPEEWYSDKDMVKIHKDMSKITGSSISIRKILVKVHFLKPCSATTVSKAMEKENNKYMQDKFIGAGILLAAIIWNVFQRG